MILDIYFLGMSLRIAIVILIGLVILGAVPLTRIKWVREPETIIGTIFIAVGFVMIGVLIYLKIHLKI